jgi:hypothetical protein
MTMSPRRGSSAVLMAVVCLALLAPGLGLGEGFTRVSVPVPVEVDGQRMHCKLYLKVEMKSYNLPFDKFAAAPMDKAQSMFATAVDAIRKQDEAKFASVWTSPDEMKGRSEVTVKMSDESVGNWIKVARSNFDFDRLTVVAEVLVGPDSMFIFDSPSKAGVQRYALFVGSDQKDRVRLSAVSSATPVDLMVLNAFVAAKTDPDQYKPSPNINLRYQYSIPLAGKLDSGPHPVFLEFDGQPMDFPLSDEKSKALAPTPVLEVLKNATLAYQSGKNDVYTSSFTPKSQEKVKQWLAATEVRKQQRLEQEKLEEEKHKQTTPPPAAVPSTAKPATGKPATTKPETAPPVPSTNVKFVLSADPVFLVFQAPNAGSKWMPGNLTYSYMLRQGSDYKIANFAYSTTLDDFLQDPSLFDKNVLKPAPSKPGTDAKAKAVPTPAKPTAVKKN